MEAVQARKQRMISGALTDQEVRTARIEELKMLFTWSRSSMLEAKGDPYWDMQPFKWPTMVLPCPPGRRKLNLMASKCIAMPTQKEA